MRSAFLTVGCLVALACAPSVAFAKKAESAPPEPPAAILLDEEDFSSWDAILTRQLPEAAIRDAERLRQAGRELRHGGSANALALAKKIEAGSPLASYARYYESVALKKLARYNEALRTLPAADDYSTRFGWDVFWNRLDLLALSKRTAELGAAIASARKSFGRDKVAAIKADYFSGKGALLAGNKREAFGYFSNVLVGNPGSEYDDRILVLLRKKGIPESFVLSEGALSQRADRLIETGFAHRGRAIYERLAAQNPSTYREKLAYATFRERNYVHAAKLYADLIGDGGAATPKPALMTSLAQALARRDDIPGALAINQKIIAEFPGTSAAAQARAKLGFLYFDGGFYDKALSYFSKSSGGSRMRASAAWYRFWSHYLTGNDAKALAEAKALLTAYGRGEGAAQFNYWIGRVSDRMGKRAEAKASYQKAASAGGDTYYGLLARQRLEHGTLKPGTMIGEDLLGDVPGGGGAVLAQVDLKVAGLTDRLSRALLLYRSGFDNYAFDETRKLLKAGFPAAGKNALLAMELAGDFHYAFASKGAALSGRIPGCGAACGYQAAYSEAYRKYVEPFSNRWNLDPNLAYAVMRQESAFKPEALSNAYAYGLMQIIPPTGEEIAGLMPYPDFHTSLLNQPRVNTLFGTYYLRHLLDKLGGVPVYAIAGYNAGPDAVGRWVRKYGKEELDVFVELIAYEQTYDYVKKVLVNYLTYKKLYR